MHVLIADDDPVLRSVLGASVEHLGHRCTAVDNGRDALHLLLEEQPEVLITDWQMPSIGGTELVRKARESDEFSWTYVVVLTGLASAEDAREAMKAGANELLYKPLDLDKLERTLIAAGRAVNLHRELYRDARVGALTGVCNRRCFDHDHATMHARAVRYGHGYCVAIFDVDRFKALNDAAGHQAGDDVLRQVAGALAASLRTGDVLYRFGGEEFVALLPEQTEDSGGVAAERLRAAVEELQIAHPEGGGVTVSGGVAALGADESRVVLLQRADEALYDAKAAGRNITVLASARSGVGARSAAP